MTHKALDAIALLKADHREVEEMFAKVQAEEISGADKEELVADICQCLTIHARLEEEIAYPAFREAGVDAATMDEAEIEHATFEQLVEELQDMRAGDGQYDARIKVLSKYVKQHVKEEENEMFPDAEAAGVNLAEIGRRLTNRKREMMAGAGDQPVAVPLTARRQA